MPNKRPILRLPKEGRLLMHTCCAPCSGDIIESIHESGIDFCIYYYNPNIHPQKEYEARKEENKRFAKKRGIPFIDADYDTQNWFAKTKGLENEPERGKRCTVCFDIRLEKTAEYAKKNGFLVIGTSLGISRWKNIEQVYACGKRSAEIYGVVFWDYNFRKNGGVQRQAEIVKKENMYRQEYCGCVYSIRN
jgi:predicted adenine nucleotide alpha hydrolase (AANH) superfamily ATPase